MMDYNHSANSSNRVENYERSDCIAINSASRIVENVRFSRLDAEKIVGMDTTVEARNWSFFRH